jgi:hypothetical protein
MGVWDHLSVNQPRSFVVHKIVHGVNAVKNDLRNTIIVIRR